jgi:transcriptional antiterminator RfaH
MKSYYLIHTKPNQEQIATNNLIAQSFTVFYPTAIINGKTIALFPRYIFVELDENTQNWMPIRSTKGVGNFVRFGLRFAKVPNQIIDLIKSQQQQTIDKIIDLSSHHQGDTVEIHTGAFKGQQAIFKNYNSNDRVTILLKLIGQQQTITLDQHDVVAV